MKHTTSASSTQLGISITDTRTTQERPFCQLHMGEYFFYKDALYCKIDYSDVLTGIRNAIRVLSGDTVHLPADTCCTSVKVNITILP